MALFDKAPISIPCPGCGVKSQKTIAWIKTHKSYTCSGCGKVIELDAGQFRSAVNDVDESIKKFQRNIAAINKRMR